MPKMDPKSKGQKSKLDFEKSKAQLLLLRKQRLQSLIRVLKKFQQSGSQNPQLNEKIKMFEDQLKRQEAATATANTATSFARRATTAAIVSEEPESGKNPGGKI